MHAFLHLHIFYKSIFFQKKKKSVSRSHCKKIISAWAGSKLFAKVIYQKILKINKVVTGGGGGGGGGGES